MSISEASFNFSSLRIIDLSHNEFIGPLPGKLFQNLRAMKVVPKETPGDAFLYKGTAAGVTYVYYHYQTSVNITTKRQEIELVKTLSIFVSMDFSDNQFSGGIPYELGQLISLQALNFSNNKLSGPIPPSLANMVALESLDLSSNKLGGRIPSELTNLTFLAVLNLSENELVGPIPNGMQFATFGNDSYSGNLGLCGFPLSKQCGNNQIDQGPKPGDEHQGSAIEIPFIWTVVMMRYGCGVVFGLSMGYIIFTIGRPWWIVVKIERDWQDNVTNWIRRIRASRNFSNVG
ncbi:hypothetical protein COLO4_17545 [Corchorus olitorius]|uniref:Uncharacterized protein n=1 Tax=Corchorus olitorius TaxID=93759 RepID=A0A1R3JCG1_9ROSI|nr:hypothetical protein COLO4_17545 [Corchorus olitorius]